MGENRARAGDQLVVVACCGRGPVAVLASRRETWRCSGCKSGGYDLERLTLGPDGALPEIATVETSAAGAAPGPWAENGGAVEDVSKVAAVAGGT